MPPPRIFYFNALFDHHLGEYDCGAVARATSEMTVLFVALGTSDDSVLLDIDVPDDYRDYLCGCGLKVPSFINSSQPGACRGMIGHAWGWDTQALTRLRVPGACCDTPDPGTVKLVNNRRFCNRIAAILRTGVPGSRFCLTRESLQEALGRGQHEFPYVIKPAFGGSGFGFMRFESPADIETHAALQLGSSLWKNGAVIEPWKKRVLDISSSVDIEKDGTLSRIDHYRCHTNSNGAFYGVVLAQDDPQIAPWRAAMESHAKAMSEHLAAEGYFGPAGYDSFTYENGSSGNNELAPIIEINGRHVISDIARHLRASCSPDHWGYFRFMTRRRCALPDTYARFRELIGDDCFDPQTRRGIIAVTPLRIRHPDTAHWQQPARSAFYLAAESESKLMAMDERLRAAI